MYGCIREGTIASKVNVTPKCVTFSEKLQLTAAVRNEIWPQKQIWIVYVIMGKCIRYG